MKLLRILFGNLPLKLLALALAFIVWYTVRRDLETNVQVTFTVQLQENEHYEAKILRQPEPALVRLDVVGSAEETQAFKDLPESQKVAKIRIRDDELEPGEGDDLPKRYQLNDLVIPSNLKGGLKIRAMQPSYIDVRIRRVDVRSNIPVQQPKLDDSEITEAVFRLIDYTETITVRGRKDVLRGFNSVSPMVSRDTLKELVNRLGKQTTQSFSDVPLEFGTDDPWKEGLTLVSPDRLIAKIQVTSEKTVSFWVPIYIDYRGAAARNAGELKFVAEAAGPENWTASTDGVEPPRVLLPFVGPPRQIDAFQQLVDKGKVLAFVLANDVDAQDGFANLRVRVELEDQPRGVIPAYLKFPLVGVETVK